MFLALPRLVEAAMRLLLSGLRVVVVVGGVLLGAGCVPQREIGFRAYKAYLARQEGEAQRVPAALIGRVQDSYATDLADVRFFTDVDTISGKVVTIGDKIYYPSRLLLDQPQHIKSLLHELRHVDQYAAEGEWFFEKYATQVIFAGIGDSTNRTTFGVLHMHDDERLEEEARATADRVFDGMHLNCRNGTCRGLETPRH